MAREGSSKLIPLFGGVALVTVAGVALVWWAGVRVTRINEQITRDQDVEARLIELQNTMTDAETGQRGFLLTHDEKYLASYLSAPERTHALLAMAGQARRQCAKLLLFTTDAASPLAGLVDQCVVIPAPSFRMAEGTRARRSVQPLGTLFEQSVLLLCDSLILELMQRTGVNAAEMFERHANLE